MKNVFKWNFCDAISEKKIPYTLHIVGKKGTVHVQWMQYEIFFKFVLVEYVLIVTHVIFLLQGSGHA